MTTSRTTLSEQIGALLTEVDLGDLPDTPKMRKIMLKAEIMAMMLNGTINWSAGCAMRIKIDEHKDSV